MREGKEPIRSYLIHFPTNARLIPIQWESVVVDYIVFRSDPENTYSERQVMAGNEHNTQQQGPRGTVLQAQFDSENHLIKPAICWHFLFVPAMALDPRLLC